MGDTEFIIIVRCETFILTCDQLRFDYPNYFTVYFGIEPTHSRNVTTGIPPAQSSLRHRDPLLFRVIESYLSGYDILPLPEHGWPQHMSKQAALKNLLADAKYYRLNGLVQLLQSSSEQITTTTITDGPASPTASNTPATWRILKKAPSVMEGWAIKEVWTQLDEVTAEGAAFWIERAKTTHGTTVFPPKNEWPGILEDLIGWVQPPQIYIIGKVVKLG